jgi:hypothetical protein
MSRDKIEKKRTKKKRAIKRMGTKIE